MTNLDKWDLIQPVNYINLRGIGIKWLMTQTADGHLGPGLNGRRPFGVGLNGQWWTFETSDVTWSQKSTWSAHIKSKINAWTYQY